MPSPRLAAVDKAAEAHTAVGHPTACVTRWER